uniref:GNAS complex locus n=1 Tax=Sus scrofa TaxID=9823 RepID=A5GFU1_PIG|nr:GNAS complex locus [Sus scrofa]
METTVHPLRKPCPSRSSSPAWGASGLPRSTLETPLGPVQALRPPAQRSWSPEPSGRPYQAWEATALRQKKLCPLSLSSLPREAAANLSCRSQTLLQEAQVRGSLELLPRSPELSDLQTQASEEAAALPLRRICHVSLMEQPLGTTAHLLGSPELSHKSTAVATARSRRSRSRVRSSSLPPRTSPPSGSQAAAAAHLERLSDLLHTSQATAPQWRSPDPSAKLASPPMGSTTLPSTWTAPQSRLTARPSRSPEPPLRESRRRERDPQPREKKPTWKEDQPPLPQREAKSPIPGMEPRLPGQPLPLQPPGQPLPSLPLQPQEQPLRLQPKGQPRPPLIVQPLGQPLPPRMLLPPGQRQPPQPLLPPEQPQLFLPPGQPQPLLPPGQPQPPGPLLPPGPSLTTEPDPRSVSLDPPAPRSRLPTRLLRSLLARMPGGAGLSAAANATTMKSRSAATAETNPTMGPSDVAAGSCPGETAAAESPGATCSATSSSRLSEAASADLRAPSPEAQSAPRSRRFPWRRSADKHARKASRSAPRSARRRDAASSSRSNSRTRRWATCVRTACCF